MEAKQPITLTGVPRTLLIPLMVRAQFSQDPASPIHDRLALELVNQINYDFEELARHTGDAALFMLARAWHFDRAIKAWLHRYPLGTVVNLGAGLDTTFYRINDPQVTWIDLDLPDIIQLRKSLLPSSTQIHQIAKSILDFSWMEDVKKQNDPILFFAGGLFMYFTEAEVRRILTSMAENFPNSQLIFDNISTKGLYYANKMLRESDMPDAIMHWGLDDAEDLEEWSPYIRLLNQMPTYRGIKMMSGIPLGNRIKMFFYDFFDSSGITHLTFQKQN